MNHKIITYTLLAGLAVSLPAGCKTTAPEASKTPAPAPAKAAAPAPAKAAAPAPAKKLTPQEEAAAKRKAEEEAKRLAREQENKRQKELEEAVKKLGGKTEKKIVGMLELMGKPEYAAARHQDWLAGNIISASRAYGAWDFDPEYPDKEFPGIVDKIMKNDKVAVTTKARALAELALYDCDREKYKEAEELSRRAVDMIQIPADARPDFPNGINWRTLEKKQQVWIVRSDVYRLQERYDDARNVIREALKANPKGFPNKELLFAGADLCLSYRKMQDAEEFTNQLSLADRLAYFRGGPFHWARLPGVDEMRGKWLAANAKKLDYELIMDPKTDLGTRHHAALRYLTDPEIYKIARETVLKMKAKNQLGWWHVPGFGAFQTGEYDKVIALCNLFEGTIGMDDVKKQRMHVVSLQMLGKTAEAIGYAAKYGENPKLKPVDKVRFQIFENILRGKPIDALVKDSGLTRKEQADVLLTAARTCVTWNMNDLALKYTAEYDKYFLQKEKQVLNVKYFAEPVSNITAWRKIRPQLETKLCDIPFKADLAMLETDVVTGRSVHFEKNAKIQNFMEVSSLCDEDGVHIFLAVKDDNARKIEHGFAGGMGTEMYFAPGFNQPYYCFGSSPVKGVEFLWNSTYDNKNQRRLDQAKPALSFRSETEFTDTDYVLHLFFAWDNFYMKLPNAGTEYRFECISWTPAGGFSWGGTRGIHGASDWGSLKFNLTGQQLNAIRRKLIYRYYKNWKTYPQPPGAAVNYFTLWADPEVGDPEFYKTVLVPLEKELDSYSARVREDMTDAEVAEIYTKALPRWAGFRDELDLLRKQYLQDQMMKK